MPLTFHVLDVTSRDELIVDETEDKKLVQYNDNEESDDDEVQTYRKKPTSKNPSYLAGKRMVIHLFGMAADGRHIKCDVKGFKPYFYISAPDGKADRARAAIRDYLSRHLREDTARLVGIESCQKSELFGFQHGRKVSLLKLTIPSMALFYETRKLFLGQDSKPATKSPLSEPYKRGDSPRVYEANLDPMLRFIHVRNIRPCGWVTLDYIDEEDCEPGEDIACECEWDEISPCENSPRPTAPFKQLSWDIECMSNTGDFPQPERGDPVIQIGCILQELGSNAVERHIFAFPDCAPVQDVVVHAYKTEKAMLLAWFQWVADQKVDILMGYNVFGFDEKYVWKRCESLGLVNASQVQELNRLYDEGGEMKLEEKRLSSSAMGDNFLYLWTTTGRLRVDMFHAIKRNYALGSYKLDDTSRNFLSEKLVGITEKIDHWCLSVDLKKSKQEVRVGKSIVLLNSNGDSLTEKCDILAVDDATGVITIGIPDDVEAVEVAKWAVVKDDVSPAELFALQKGTPEDRGKIAKYCVQDCQLVLDLYKKLETFNNAMSMANICSVPVSYIFLRGQGIKIESLMFKYCAERNQVIQVLPAPSQSTDSYEGAIVLPPTPGLYNVPIGVADFASLYPSTIMSENISHDTIVWVKDYDRDGNFVGFVYGSDQYDNLPGVRYTDIEYDISRVVPGDMRKNPAKEVVGQRVCRYAQDAVGTIPQIVAGLLAARKAKRKEAEKESDPFRVALLDSEQLAYKLTANSLYGQLGSGTFKVRFQALAASVTAYARRQIMFSKAAIEQAYGPTSGNPRSAAEIIYGDTDSLFIAFHPKDPATGKPLEGRAALEATVELTEEAGKFVTGALKAPHDFEFDKVYWPFIIFSKKRYVGYKYMDIEKPYEFTTMGVALKRRDYAPIVKKIYGGAIHTILSEKDVGKAVEYVKDMSKQLMEGRFGLQPLTISKSLRAEYANPAAIPHKALADRIAIRTPGNAPASGDRIPFVYILPSVGQKASDLQADRIETPSYIREKGLKPDYQYYIDHQISNPVCQLFGTLLEQIPGFVAPSQGWHEDPDKRDAQRESAAYEILFKDAGRMNEQKQKARFIEKLFGQAGASSSSASGQSPTQGTAQRKSPRLAPSTAEKPKVQSTLDSAFFDALRIKAHKTSVAAKKKAQEAQEAQETSEEAPKETSKKKRATKATSS